MHSLEASDDTRRHRSTGTTPTGKYFTFERSDSVRPICHLRSTPVYGSYVSCAENVRIKRVRPSLPTTLLRCLGTFGGPPVALPSHAYLRQISFMEF